MTAKRSMYILCSKLFPASSAIASWISNGRYGYREYMSQRTGTNCGGGLPTIRTAHHMYSNRPAPLTAHTPPT